MKIIVLLYIAFFSLNSFADWTIESKEYFQQKTKLVKDSTEFVDSYLKEISSLSNKELELIQVITQEGEVAFIYQFSNNKKTLSFDCLQYENLTECLYGSYDKYLFVVLNSQSQLVSIGNSNMLPRNAIRFGESIVEQEAFFFLGENAGTAIIENW